MLLVLAQNITYDFTSVHVLHTGHHDVHDGSEKVSVKRSSLLSRKF